MKKSILSVIAIALVGLFAFTSCGDKKTMTDHLTNSKGWTLSEATTTPYWTLNDNSQISDLFEGYVYDCEKDDVIKFNADGFEYLNPGADVCEWEPSQESSIGKWAINEEEKVLDMQIPFFYDDEVESCKIMELNKDQLKVSYTWTLTEDPAKGVPGTYTFTLVYVPAK
jgi:predicted PP-loop superfamily ATPase